ncbi:MAG: YggS family pyridoxal phosphate-dependent enzyme [Gammaproteobacteria bacterium]
MTRITEQLARLRARIEAAALAAGRNPAEIRLLGVSKRQPVDRVLAALAAGVTELGENYLQDALPRMAACGPGPHWHFIGRIQSNKSRSIAENFSWVQTLDNRRLADRLATQRPTQADPLQCLIQIAPRGGEDRGGAAPAEVAELAAHLAELPRLTLRGLMVMPLPGQDADSLSSEFAAGRRLFKELCAAGYELDTLSMGMSHDLEMAVAEGSTLLRIGTDLFGPREN